MATLHRVASIHEIPPGTGKVITVQGKNLGIFNIDGTFHALDNTCPHRGGPLNEGPLNEHHVACPWHGWRFDVRTGVCLTNPASSITCHPVSIDGDSLFVQLEL